MKRIVGHRYFIPGVILAVLAVAFATIPGLRDAVPRLWGRVAGGDNYVPPTRVRSEQGPAELVLVKGEPAGLRLTEEARNGVNPGPKPAKDPKLGQQRSLPPQFGTINYDNDRMFIIRSRFPGEVAEFKPRHDLDSPIISPTKFRPLRVGDKVQQNELLAVVWSQQLGTAKAALVDAISALRLSQDAFERAKKLYEKDGALAEGAFKQFVRQRQADYNAMLTAERSLRFWKLEPKEIDELKAEAASIAKEERIRLLDDEMKWGRVEVRAPVIKWLDPDTRTKPDPNVWLTIVEKNTNINDMLDPIASPAMFKLADLSRLQVMVQPHEEYYPLLRSQKEKGTLNWKLQVTAYPNARPLEPNIVQVLPAIDFNLRTCIVTGYIESPDLKYLVGQFVTATIFVDPEEGTVEIPTDALNDVEGESLVFVQDPKDKLTFSLRRVAVAQRFKEFCYIRSKLTDRDKQISDAEVEKGNRPIEELKMGDLVVTNGIVELKAAFDTLSAKYRVEKLQLQGN